MMKPKETQEGTDRRNICLTGSLLFAYTAQYNFEHTENGDVNI